MFTDLHRAILTAKNSYMNLEHGIWCPSMCSETWLVWILSSIRNGNVISNKKVCSHYDGNKFITKTAHQFQLNLVKGIREPHEVKKKFF